jgi:class 3 adenylate cyclase
LGAERVDRRLAAILAADVVGYSRLMGQDDAGTLARLRVHRRDLIDPKVTEHRGRVVKTTGDGILIEFPSVVEAVACAVAVQQGMAERNAGTPERQRIAFRVGTGAIGLQDNGYIKFCGRASILAQRHVCAGMQPLPWRPSTMEDRLEA